MHHNHMQSRAALQGAGEQFAARWIEAADGFISCFYWALAFPGEAAYVEAVTAARDTDLWLEREHLPTGEHWNLLRILCGLSERRIAPTPEKILQVAVVGKLHLPGGAGDPLAELKEILCACASAANLLHFGRELQRFARKAAQVRRLWRVLRDLIEDEKPARRPAAQLRGRVVS